MKNKQNTPQDPVYEMEELSKSCLEAFAGKEETLEDLKDFIPDRWVDGMRAEDVLILLASEPSTPAEILEKIICCRDRIVRDVARANPNMSRDIVANADRIESERETADDNFDQKVVRLKNRLR